MRQITIADVHKRLSGLKNEQSDSRLFIESAQQLINSKNPSEIIRFIEGASKGNLAIPFYTYTELFESVIENGTVGDISKLGTYITENIIHKVRDSKSTQSLIKRRLSRLQNKIKNSVSKKLNASNKSKNSIKKEQTAIEAYEAMLEKSIIMHHCDRVIENYNKISKRFNLDSLFVENSRYNGIRDTVIELCNRIDTYDMPSTVKFNTVIETAWYGFESNSIEYNKSEILEAAVDYFYFKSDGLSACKEILEATLFYDKNEDMGNIDIITEEEPEEDSSNNVEESVMLYSSINAANNIKITNESSFEELFNKFKEEELPKDDKPERKLRSLVNKLYSKNVSSIVEGTPDLLQWIRRFFIIGTGAVPVIGPILMIVTYIADKFISLHYDREQVPKMIKCFNNEIKASKNKLKTTEGNEDKEKLKKYIDSLEKARDKLDDYYNELLTEKEQEDRYDNMDDEDFDFDFDDEYGDFMDDDDDFDFDDELLEAVVIRKMANNIEGFINLTKLNHINESSMFDLVFKLSDDDLINVSTITAAYPDTFYKNSLIDAIESMLTDIRKENIKFATVIDRVTKISTLKSALQILRTPVNNPSDGEINIYNSTRDMNSLNEAYRAIDILIDTYNNQHHLLEASITNTIKMASMKLKNAITKLNDKEKSISRNVDVGLNSFRKNIERALTNDNRESIIKGSILPSASKIIKLCLVNAGLLVLNQPILAIITTLGYLGVSAKFKSKERQMIIDEIDIELEMCEKYINIAEQKNDMKALKQLLMTKKELERQRQRIKYKMKVDFGQKYTDSTDGNNQ